VSVSGIGVVSADDDIVPSALTSPAALERRMVAAVDAGQHDAAAAVASTGGYKLSRPDVGGNPASAEHDGFHLQGPAWVGAVVRS
jgi:hypothetical protein